MRTTVLIAHAKGEEKLAEQLAAPICEAGYEVVHGGTLLVGDSMVAEYSKLLDQGAAVVVCGTVRAMGTSWAKKVANAARGRPRVKLFVVQMEEDADVETVSFDEMITQYWKDPFRAGRELATALNKRYPLDEHSAKISRCDDLESRFRELTLRACDIIDLANLPRDDRNLAVRELELRRLYVPLQMRIEPNFEAAQRLQRQRPILWGDNRRQSHGEDNSASPGGRLKVARRLVILGDPGAGKSTLLRWFATAFLLRLKKDPDWRDLPAIATLPDEELLPILVRCRDLQENTTTLNEILYHSLRKIELNERECEETRSLLVSKLKHGNALLLIDGLDEITEPAQRVRFSEQLSRIHHAYPIAPIVVTSRIVGYREMGYRISDGFEHLVVADLTREDKDDFARRWCGLTERGERKELAAAELIHDIHSSDRIERLTGNPMLLTTMALIKRKIGKLPQRRVELYEKTVEVLLNWRSAVDAALDPREALPQLRYLAYAMCQRGVQQLREDEVLELLCRVREEYPQIYPLGQHTPEEFLALLERRTGLFVQTGHTRHNGGSVPVYEFRHLTIQEYLAGMALVQGHFPDRDREKSLADIVAPLAGQVGSANRGIFGVAVAEFGEAETAVAENWREALRLCVCACNDDDVDDVILAILTPQDAEEGTARPRAALAALCLADEPNASENVAQIVLNAFAKQVTEGDGNRDTPATHYDDVAVELFNSRWREALGTCLVDEFFIREAENRGNPGSLATTMLLWGERAKKGEHWLKDQATILNGEKKAAAYTALQLMGRAYANENCATPEIVAGLLDRVHDVGAISHAAAWALGWFVLKGHWQPTLHEVDRLIVVASNPDCDPETMIWLATIFGKLRSHAAVPILQLHLRNASQRTRLQVMRALGDIGDKSATGSLLALLINKDAADDIRQASAAALGKLGDESATVTLLKLAADTQELKGLRQTAVRALGDIGDKSATGSLLALLINKDAADDIRQASAAALGKLGDESATVTLLKLAADTQELKGLRQTAVRALGDIGDKSATGSLLALLINKDAADDIRQASAAALGKLGDESATVTLLKLAADTQELKGLRQTAVRALGDIGDKSATGSLLALLINKGEAANIRQAAAAALGELGDQSATDVLLRFAADTQESAELRKTVEEALRNSVDRSVAATDEIRREDESLAD